MTGMAPASERMILEKLLDLAEGRLTRDEASAWAMQYIESDSLPEDEAMCRAVMRLGNADAAIEPSAYIYHKEDFQSWLEDLKAGV